MAEEMTGRQRVLTACAHQEPDRVPLEFGGRVTTVHRDVHRDLLRHLGLEPQGEDFIRGMMTQTVEPDPRLVEMLGRDTLSIYPKAAAGFKLEVDPKTDSYLDEWGTRYQRPPGGFYYDPVEWPLFNVESVSELDNYPWPNPEDPARLAGLVDEIKQAHAAGEKAILLGSPTLGIWMQPQFLRGMENAMMDLAFNRPLAEALAERMTEWYERWWTFALGQVGEYVDFCHMEGDLGTQYGPLFSPQTFREVYKGRFRRIADTIKKHSNAQVWLHSCGSVYWALPDLIEAGVEVLNPVQVNAVDMETDRLKREFGRDLTFWGGGCDTAILQFGSPAEVEAEVKKRIDDLAPGGGFVFGSVHNIQINVPPENIVTMFKTAREYGVYKK